MEAFTYSYPVKTYFGKGAAAAHLPAELAKVGPHVLLAYGGGSIKRNGVYSELMAILEKAGKTVFEFSGIMSNPTYEKVQEGARLAREQKIDFILAVGGGSVIDCCKIISAQALLEEDIWEYEYAQHQQPEKFLPMGAVVTAFGTGAEMNNGAVITHEAKKSKSPLWGAFYDFAILDPSYTLTMPLGQVISGAFDSLSHCMETYLGAPREVNLSDEINEACQRNIIRNIRKDPPGSPGLQDPQRTSLGSCYGRKRHPEDWQDRGLPVPYAGTPAGGLHQLQSWKRPGRAASGAVPPLSARSSRTICPPGREGMVRGCHWKRLG